MNWLADWNNEELLFVAGDPGFEDHTTELIGRFKDEIQNMIRKRVKAMATIDEVEATVWMNVLTGKNTFVPVEKGSARKWLLKIADNAALDCLRRRAREKAYPSQEQVEPLPCPDPEAQAVCEEQESHEQIRRAILRLPGERQAVLLLTNPASGVDGIGGLGLLTQQQVSDLLGCSGPPAIHRNLESTRAILKRLVGVTPSSEDDG